MLSRCGLLGYIQEPSEKVCIGYQSLFIVIQPGSFANGLEIRTKERQ